MKKHTRKLLIAAGSTLICLLAFVGSIVNKDSMIIRYHYSGWRRINIISMIVFIIGAINLALNLILCGYEYWQKQKANRSEQEQAAQREAELIESKKLRTPEDVRQFIIDICDKCPHCQIAKMIRDQLDEMNGYQDRFEKLLEVNDLEMAEDSARKMLQDTENEICDDCRSAINAFIIDDVIGFEEAAKPVYERNAYRLGKAKEFLDNLGSHASEQVTSGDAVQNLEIFGEAINASTNKGG